MGDRKEKVARSKKERQNFSFSGKKKRNDREALISLGKVRTNSTQKGKPKGRKGTCKKKKM